jgi:hypothetical protein
MLHMKKIEMLLAKESDAGKKAELENKLKQLQIENDEYMTCIFFHKNRKNML